MILKSLLASLLLCLGMIAQQPNQQGPMTNERVRRVSTSLRHSVELFNEFFF
jgi:hypothetical protein